MEYNAITKTCTDVGIRACCLLVLVLYFMFDIEFYFHSSILIFKFGHKVTKKPWLMNHSEQICFHKPKNRCLCNRNSVKNFEGWKILCNFAHYLKRTPFRSCSTPRFWHWNAPVAATLARGFLKEYNTENQQFNQLINS